MRYSILLLCLSCLLFSCGHEPGNYRAAVKIDGHYGYIDETGEFVIDPSYDEAWVFIHGSAVVKENGRYGLIDKMGNWVTEPVYDSVFPFSPDCFIVQKDDAYGFVEHGTGKVLVAPQYDQVYNYTLELCVVQKGNALGVVNSKGVLTCAPQLQDFKEMYGPLAIVVQSDTSDEMQMLLSIIDGGNVKLGLLSRKGEYIVPCTYDDMFEDVANGYYFPFILDEARENADPMIGEVPVLIGKYGIIDTTGKILCEPAFDEMPVYGDGMFRVRLNGKYGFADAQGKVVIAPQWEFAVAFSEGKAIVSNKGNSSIIDKNGKIIAANLGNGTGMYRFFSNRARCRSNDGAYGYMDGTGKRVIAPTFDSGDDFIDGAAIVGKGNQYGLIDTMGNFLIEPAYDFLFSLGDGLYKAKDAQGRAGVLNRNGEVIVASEYDDVFHLQKNYLMVEKDYLNGCFDLNGKMIYPAQSLLQLLFIDGRSIVTSDRQSGMIDTTGSFVIPLQYDSVGYFYRGFTAIRKNGVYGAVDSTGKVVVEPKYTRLQPFVNGYAVFRQQGKFGYVNAKGEEIVKAKFEDAGVMVDPEFQVF